MNFQGQSITKGRVSRLNPESPIKESLFKTLPTDVISTQSVPKFAEVRSKSIAGDHHHHEIDGLEDADFNTVLTEGDFI